MSGAFNITPGRTTAGADPALGRVTAPRRRRRWPWVAAALVVAVAAGAGAWWRLQPQTPDAGPADRTPVVLPNSLAGYAYDEQVDFADTENWAEPVREEFYGDDHAFGGAAYLNRTPSGRLQPPQLNLIVVRGYFPEGGDLAMAREPFIRHGAVTCTHTLNLAEAEGKPRRWTTPRSAGAPNRA